MKEDKFILIGLDDDRSKKIAEVLGNKTCKKIIDHLVETKEASEKDISDKLNIPINTIEYNLKKLLDSGLIEKTKNFFWSKKGKKIDIYKLANKHIVISPKSKPDLSVLKTILPIIVVVAFVFALIALLQIPSETPQDQEINKFSSLKELKDFIKENTIEGGRGGIMETFAGVAPAMETSKSADTSSQSNEANDYSSTNIQVQGVDEADIIKNDGKYIYAVSENKLIILDAYPAEDMEILSEINFNNEGIRGIFINENKLIAFSNNYGSILYESEVRCMAIGCVIPQQESKTNIYIYNIEDRKNPELENSISVSGNYHDSRMIGDYVYIINNQYIYKDGVLPVIETNKATKVIEADEIYYTPIKDYSFQYTIILAVNIETGEVSEKTLLTGMTQNIFVSKENIYTTFIKYPQWYHPMKEVEQESLIEKTIINKFLIDEDKIEYLSTGEVDGHILNQFSMDEYEGNFRIATTIGEVWDSRIKSTNNVYILDEELNLIGKLEGLAPGESIYSVRFMGEKGYVVTFKKIDPLFVIDLSNPENPEVLGKLKIPGYSDYLHPYDENHIIGIGKDTVEAEDELNEQRDLDFAWYQGVKIAIFDVSDVENPIEMHKIVIGDRGTDSLTLQDHKAFLFDREKELLVIPITLAEIQSEPTSDHQYGEFTFQGAYVYNVNLKDGFELNGRITHNTQEDELKRGYYFDWNNQIQRALYMDDVLYTFSTSKIKSNDLKNLDEINVVEL
ncbi:MAG: beta-propeller domain-containing protein [Nanoarchaeota archaeon]